MSTEHKETQQTIVNVGGMGCSGCVSTVKKALESKEGISSADVDLDKETASINYDPNRVSVDDFRRIIADAGYEFKGIR